MKRIFVRFLLLTTCILSLSSVYIQTDAFAADFEFLNQKKIIKDIEIRGVKYIDKSLLYSSIESRVGAQLSPLTVKNDIKTLYQFSYFSSVDALINPINDKEVVLIFEFVEKPRISEITIMGNTQFSTKVLTEKLKVYKNNMVNIKKIKQDVQIIKDEYFKKGYMQTHVAYKLIEVSTLKSKLIYQIDESPKVYLTEINITGPEYYYPIDIIRRLQSAEIDCWSWANSSGVFHEEKVNVDLQIITQTYLQEGFIRLNIDKPKVKIIKNPDYARVVIDINLVEGDQYFTGDIKFVSDDGEDFLFDPKEQLEMFTLQKGEVYNPFALTKDRFKLLDIYLERGYAFSKILDRTNINDDTKIVDITYHVTRKEKAYIGRVEIQGNYDTKDQVVRRELEIHDNELYNGMKIRQSQQNINRLGFFKPGTGIRFNKTTGNSEQTLDYNIQLEESMTGSFNGGLSYSEHDGGILNFSISQRNLFGTGRSIKFSAEYKQAGDNKYSASLTTPYWFDTLFTNTVGIYASFVPDDDYDTNTLGFNYGLGYPIWKDWTASGRYSWRNERYTNISPDGEESLEGSESDSYKSFLLGLKYSTVNNPMFPSNGVEASFNAEEFGGVLGGSTDYREYNFNTRYFKSLNEAETVIFAFKYNQGYLQQTNPDNPIPTNQRYSIGGITTVHGFGWYDIEGPSGDVDIREKHPYQGDYGECSGSCLSLPTERHPDRVYFQQHLGGNQMKVLNLELLFPLTREGQNLRGVVFFDAGNVYAEDRMYEIAGTKKDEWAFRRSTGLGARIITPMGVLRFEYGVKLDKKEGESAGKFDFHISGLF